MAGTRKAKNRFREALLMAALALALPMALCVAGASAQARYHDDGAEQNALGGWDLPKSSAADPKGIGEAGIGWCSVSPTTALTRPECEALRIVAANSGECSTAGGSWTTNSVCNDPARTDQTSCEAAPGRLWNAGSGICSVTMKGHNRNNAVCLNSGGVWAPGVPGTCRGSWTMPARDTYTPALYTSTGPGDQCLRCHNSITEWNTNRVRDVESVLLHGHKNMARKVTVGLPWAGPSGAIYPTDSNGVAFDWVNGTIGGDPLFWIYGDWLGPLPRVFSNSSTSYSCGRCHMTGWQDVPNANMEPELSFPGIRTGRSITGSWNQYGITCTRCHEAATHDFVAAGNPQGSCSVSGLFTSASCVAGGGTWNASSYPATAPVAALGYSTHHNDVTQFDAVNGGYCTDNRFRSINKEQCLYWGGTWFSQCSDDSGWRTQAQCEATEGCSNPAFTTQATCEAGGMCSNPYYSTSPACAAGGGVWTSPNVWSAKTPGTWALSSCSIAEVCDRGGACSNPAYADKWTCEAASETWSTPADAAACTAVGGTMVNLTNLFACMDAGGKWTGTRERRGQLITALCMNCHRQETGGNPYDGGANPAGLLKVGPSHGAIGFVGHPHANQFLNSPHAKFTGTFAEIGTAVYGAGYDSHFMGHGEAANTGNGCTGCHNVHSSIVEETGAHEHSFHEKCTDCHAGPYKKDLTTINHLWGDDTPMEHAATDESSACISCHMPHGLHLWRINASASYSTFPPGALTGVVNANTEPDGSYTNAVWADVDMACGQCHGGGTGQAESTGSITTGTKILTLADATDFTVGSRIRVEGAGALEEDGVTREDLETVIVSIAGNDLTLPGNVSVTVAGAKVLQNPTRGIAPPFTKAALALVAKGMHDSAAESYPVTFSYTIGSPNTLEVTVDAEVTCGGPCPALTYDWNWGDGDPNSSGDPATHTYATAGSKTISLTVKVGGKSVGTASRSLNLKAPDLPPTADAVCTWDPNTWTMQVVDASTDDGPDGDTAAGDGEASLKIVVDWGDGSTKAIGGQGATYSRTYIRPGTFTVTVRAIDSKLQQDTYTCVAQATPAYFTISGTIQNKLGTKNLSYAVVRVIKGSTIVKTVYSKPDGTFTSTSLKPATYTLRVTKKGYTFANPAATIVLGPSSAGNTINATAP